MARKKVKQDGENQKQTQQSREQSGQMQRKSSTKEKTTTDGIVPVVGIGASAGGLEALSKFFKAMPSDAGIAYVVVQHLDPNHKSLMADLLAKHTDMEVVQAEESMAIEPDHVYVIAPNTYLTVENGNLQVSEPVKVRGMRMPIDYFFRSLGESREEKAICIVLSGTATDGTLGLRAVKSHGGLGLVQDPQTATHDGMPSSAISTGMVDFVLPVEEMPQVIVKYVRHPFIRDAEKESPLPERDQDDLQKIIALLRHRTNHDFKWYKKTTIVRRIQRRIGLNHLDNYGQYLDYLRNHPGEVELLFKELLISVTDWFRDHPAWEELKEKVLPRLFDENSGDRVLRLWVAGCATGEEAYSLAMLLTEVSEERQKQANFLIFATDVNRDSLDFARNGVYPDSISDEISENRLKRFFTKEGYSYTVKKHLRESIVFAHQNLLSDPPFSRLDFISCRNLLIYLEQTVQKKLLSVFHFSLKQNGFLFLGNSETVTQQKSLFEPVEKKWRIYRKIGVTQGNLDLPIALEDPAYTRVHEEAGLQTRRRPSVTDLAKDILLDRFVPATVLVDQAFQVIYYHGPHENYLVQPPGEPTNDLLNIARDGLRTRLRGALNTALKKQEEVVAHDARIKRGTHTQRVKITVTPVHDLHRAEGLLLVTFEDIRTTTKAEQRPEEYSPADETVVHQLEEELKITREELQSTIEELETSNEELKSSNEEVMSMNEELQSANEELETSKEELQSMNEELTTVNTQLEEKVKELEIANTDLKNLLDSTDIATIFLDTELRIKRYTPATQRIFNYLPSDTGRPISDLSHHSLDPDLPEACRQVLDELKPDQKEVRTADGQWYIRRTMPYRTEDNKIDGVVITFTDVNEIKRAESKLQKAKDLADAINDLNEIIHSTLDFEEIMHKVTARAVAPLGMEAFSIALHEGEDIVFKYAANMPEEFTGLRLPLNELKGVREALRSKEVVGFEDARRDKRLSREAVEKYNLHSLIIAPLIVKGEAIGTLNFYCLTRPLHFSDRHFDYAHKLADSVSLALENARLFTQFEKAEKAARKSEHLARRHLRELEVIYASSPVGLCFVDTELRYVKINDWLANFNGHTVEEHLGRTIREMLPDFAPTIEPYYRQVIETGQPVENREFHGTRSTGEKEMQYWVSSYFPFKNESGQVVGVNVVVQDITERKQIEQSLRESEERFRGLVEASSEVLYRMSPDWSEMRQLHSLGFLASTREPKQSWLDEYIPEEDRARVSAAIEDAITTKKVFELEHRVLRADGSEGWVSSRAVPFLDENDQIIEWFGAASDITDHKQAELALRENEALLRKVLDNMPVGVWITDETGTIIMGNPAGQNVWQGARFVAPDEFHEYKAWWLDSRKRLQSDEWAVTRAVTGGETSLNEELEIETFNGERKIISNSAIPLYDEQGRLKNVLVINLDITKQKKMEQNLRSSNAELEQFAYVASHDLKEPLRMVTSYLELLQHRYHDKLDKKGEKYINFAVEGGTRMQELIDDLLAFSHVGKQAPPTAPVEMEDVLSRTVKTLGIKIEESGAIIEHDPLPRVKGDEHQLFQLLQNLISNGLKFNESNPPEVRISVTKKDGWYRFGVRDNGIGIDKDHCEQIFTIFQRLHNRHKYPGTGIGLAICKKIIDYHGGRIWVESEPGKGSTIYFTLPKI